MKALLASMVFVYIAGSIYMGTILRRAQTLPVDSPEEAQLVKRHKPAFALAIFVKLGLVIGVFGIFLLHYKTLRYWIGAISYLLGLGGLWTAFSQIGWRHTVSPPAKHVARQILISCVLLVAITVFFYFD